MTALVCPSTASRSRSPPGPGRSATRSSSTRISWATSPCAAYARDDALLAELLMDLESYDELRARFEVELLSGEDAT